MDEVVSVPEVKRRKRDSKLEGLVDLDETGLRDESPRFVRCLFIETLRRGCEKSGDICDLIPKRVKLKAMFGGPRN